MSDDIRERGHGPVRDPALPEFQDRAARVARVPPDDPAGEATRRLVVDDLAERRWEASAGPGEPSAAGGQD